MTMRAFLLLLLACLGLQAGEDPRAVQLAEAAIARAEAVAVNLPGEWKFKLVQAPVLPPLLGPGPITVLGTHLSKRDPVGRFFVVLDMQMDGRRAGQVRVDLEGRWVGQLWRSREALARRTSIEESMLEAVPFEGVPPDGALLEMPKGMRTKGPLSAGHTLTQLDVEVIPLVQAGERVKLTAEVEGLTVTTEALARSSGALGERIRLEAPGTRKPIKAVVTGPAEAKLL
ncbi:MAG TPA: flagellar basal body P-ring formation chaperone FlgA [Holophagaceae bacterium]|nr:flagellar basal body P-ring formation chaperone FlgA [Holophagaceae bacterium]